MVTDLPARVSVAVLAVVDVLGALETVTDPKPDRDAGDVMTAQAELLDVVHEHPVGTVAVKDSGPPAAPTFVVVGVTEYVQTGAAAACVMVTELPAIVSVAVLLVVSVFAETVTPTVPGFGPDGSEVTVAQEASLDVVQGHPVALVSTKDRLPPVAAMLLVAGETA